MAGVSQRITVDDARAQRAFAELARRAVDQAPAWDEIGSMLVAGTIRRFELGVAPDGTAWRPSLRAREEGGRTLVDTGRLMGSITHVAGADFVDVGSNVVYAAIHQLGGPTGRGHVVDMPARPYLGVDAGEAVEIGNILADYLGGAVR
ncbi:MAG: phage virion morphogenesis protein [Alphaproteobacteria bacterium]